MVNTARNIIIMPKNLQQIHLKLLQKKIIQEIAEATCDLNGNKVTDGITKVSKNSQQNNSKTVTNKNNEEIPKERYKDKNCRWSDIPYDSIIMEYQKFINLLLYNTPNQLTKFRTKHWVEINYHSRRNYNDTNVTPITDCINEINNTQVDNAKYINAVRPYIIWYNTVIIIQKQELCRNIIEMKNIENEMII